ncbi:alpha/beta-Hydrolases superfamily protein [Perilla frutescens var. hirtella]|nr:alpha/beta-Hydrolases superfamily protein [Perilla frutescens var. hirtella]
MTKSSRKPSFDLRNLNASLPVPPMKDPSLKILVLGANDDFIVDAEGLNEIGRFYGVSLVCVEGVAHDMMLDFSWEKVQALSLSRSSHTLSLASPLLSVSHQSAPRPSSRESSLASSSLTFTGLQRLRNSRSLFNDDTATGRRPLQPPRHLRCLTPATALKSQSPRNGPAKKNGLDKIGARTDTDPSVVGSVDAELWSTVGWGPSNRFDRVVKLRSVSASGTIARAFHCPPRSKSYQKLMTESSRKPLFDPRKLNASLSVPPMKDHSLKILVPCANDDFIVDAKGLNETGRFYGVGLVCVEGVAHDMMLDCSWEKGAETILS